MEHTYILFDCISEGKHMLSGVGTYTMKYDYGESINVTLVCIDGIVYGAYEDPHDGYRSYGTFKKMPDNITCQYNFLPQPVIIKKVYPDFANNKFEEFMIILDAENGKEVLKIGTDTSDSYYPFCIFNYSPENFNINKDR